MYPRVTDFINDIFGTHFNLPIQSYGFFLAMAFLAGAYFLNRELKRQQQLGHVATTKRTITIGKPASITELVLIFVIAFIVGFKIFGIIFNYTLFQKDPQEFMFSGHGNLWAGILLAGVFTITQYLLKKKKALNPPIAKEVTVSAGDQTWAIVFIAVIFGIIGAKIFHQLENWGDFMKDPIGSLMSFSGLTFYGGLIVAAFAVAIYGEKNGIPWKRMADSIAPSLILAYGIGRIGCQVAGDGDWGIVNTAPMPEWLAFLPDWLWSYTYPHNIINSGIRIEDCVGPHCFELAQGVFPTPIYETTMSLIIFGILWFLRKRLSIPGMLFSIYLMFNGLERFLIEKIRVNNLFDFMGMKVTQAEVISTIIFLLGLGFFTYLMINQKKNPS